MKASWRREGAFLEGAAAAAWIAHLIMIWAYRFIPSVDYPDWLLQARVMADFGGSGNDFSRWYELLVAPVPNSGFILPAAALCRFIPAETAGKIVLTAYAIWFPLSLRSYCRALNTGGPWWIISIPMLFNISFFNGNMSFLIGLCVLLTALAYRERRRGDPGPVQTALFSSLSLAAFFSHAVCGAAVMAACAACLLNRRESAGAKRAALIALAVTAAGAAAYMLMRPAQQMITEFDWSIDLRYRLGIAAKPFMSGWVYPPYEFSAARFAGRVVFLLFGLWMGFRCVAQCVRSVPGSTAALTALAVTAFAFAGPKHIFGIAELSHRFALIGFPLLVPFFAPSARLRGKEALAAGAVALIVAANAWAGYRDASLLIGKRHDVLAGAVTPGAPILTLDDDLGERRARLLFLAPKGVSFTFQADYFLMEGGYNPLAFYTGFLIPRDRFVYFYYDLTREGEWGESTLRMRGGDIPPGIRYVILDTASGWGEKMADRLKPEFLQTAAAEIAPGLRTLVLERAARNADAR